MDKSEVIRRMRIMYTGIVSDAMDKLGLREHLLPSELRPLRDTDMVAGFAFTGRGEPAASPEDDDNQMRFAMLEAISPMDVPVWECGDERVCAHWGGMMTRSTRQAGGVGAVIWGGCRDVGDIIGQDFPLFNRFFHPGSSLGRWNIVEFQKPIHIGGIEICPGDFIFGDRDGVIVIPAEHLQAVLEKAEELFRKEQEMGRDMDENGMNVRAAFDKYGTI